MAQADVNAPFRVLHHSADGETIEHAAATVAEALAAADLSTREGRIAAIGRTAEALLASRDPALIFVGSALQAWLETDRGRLERDYLRVLAPRSHLTVARVWRALCAHAQNSDPHRPPPKLP